MPGVILSGRKVKWRCITPSGPEGKICGAPFYEGEEKQFAAHVARCTAENREWVEDWSVRHNLAEIFEGGDNEREAWVRKHGRL